MKFIRHHWFDLGLVLAVLTAAYIANNDLLPFSLLLWLSLISLFLHQFEEYRWPGKFPLMLNTVMFDSPHPDRYPLNTNIALIINVVIGWTSYFLAALLAENALWLVIATMLVSAGNFFVHTFIFNIKGRRFYNPGMATGILLFAPITATFFVSTISSGIATPLDWIFGIGLGAVLNVAGIFKMIDWLKDENTPYAFPAAMMPPDF